MNYILFDDQSRENLLPLTYTRPVAALRVGIQTIAEKWSRFLNNTCSHLTADYLMEKFPIEKGKDNLLINGSVLPNQELVDRLKQLKFNQALIKGEKVVAVRMSHAQLSDTVFFEPENFEQVLTDVDFNQVNHPWDIFRLNGDELQSDFHYLARERKSQPIPESCRATAPDNVYIEEGAIVEHAIINASTGPVYIGRDAQIMENCTIRGPFAMGRGAVLKMGAKIYGPTTLGPYCKAGGEITNSVMTGYSNKGHDGFLGNSVLGEWCNLGADTNNSNLKNNYGNVKVYTYARNEYTDSGLQFCGLIMGDHSKCGINTMFNTGTVVGVCANIFGSGFPPKHIPSFSWGGAEGFTEHEPGKAMETAARVMQRRGIRFNETEERIFRKLYEETKKYRKKSSQ
jgi:UDP-N-acetylglucosamine diphosphorylase/glucosamine-1-phosphate N-acetyltransferase